jgi:hypothetical protein
MAWNGPVNGDYTNCDWTKAPWAAVCAELTHEEVLFVIEALPAIEAKYLPDTNMVIGQYNQLTGYEKAINGQTYPVIKQYDPLVHTLGINENGIILPDETPIDTETSEDVEQPTGEEVIANGDNL